jgi:hypothetical protein
MTDHQVASVMSSSNLKRSSSAGIVDLRGPGLDPQVRVWKAAAQLRRVDEQVEGTGHIAARDCHPSRARARGRGEFASPDDSGALELAQALGEDIRPASATTAPRLPVEATAVD